MPAVAASVSASGQLTDIRRPTQVLAMLTLFVHASTWPASGASVWRRTAPQVPHDEDLRLPVWTGHGRRGDFVDYGKQGVVAGKPNWTFDEFDTGAMPQFENLPAVVRSYAAFTITL